MGATGKTGVGVVGFTTSSADALTRLTTGVADRFPRLDAGWKKESLRPLPCRILKGKQSRSWVRASKHIDGKEAAWVSLENPNIRPRLVRPMKRKEIAACPEFDFLIPCSCPSRATRPPLPVQPLDHPREREPVPFLKGPFSDAVVCARRLPVAVRTERHARVVGRLLAHTAVRPGMSGFAPPFDPAGDARHFANPCQVRLVARWALARG